MRALLLALATVSGLAAGAQTSAQTLRVNPNIVIDVTGFGGGPNLLPDAVSNVESTNGGRVAAIAYSNVAGAAGYGAIVLKGSDVRFLRLDKPTSKAVEFPNASIPTWMLKWRTQRRADAVKNAKVSLADAIRTAEAEEHGAPAVVAGIARSASNPTSDVQAYMVGILVGGRLLKVAVDSQTGSRIENPSALEW